LHPFLDPEETQLILYLHAYCYESQHEKFVTPLPRWCVTDNEEVAIISTKIEEAKQMANKAAFT
jgi:hypothetical protein